MRSILFILLLIPSISFAADPWTKEQIRDELIFAGITFIDHHMTVDLTQNHSIWEGNPALGIHPSPQQLREYAINGVLLHALITHYLPSKYREKWQWFWIGTEGSFTIGHVWIYDRLNH